MTRYVVVSGGPSVAEMDLEAMRGSLHPGARWVAVNRAFYREPAAFDIWSAGESPGRMWATVEGQRVGLSSTLHTAALLRAHNPAVWCPTHYRAEWDALVPGLCIWSHDAAQRTSPGWETDATYLDGSLTQTLAWCFQRKPERVDVYGADLAGADGYGVERPAVPVEGSTVEGLVAYSPGWWARRWVNERRALETAIREAGEHGIEVRWHREPVACPS